MYAKCGAYVQAAEVLDDLPFRDVVPWSALIAGYAKRGHGKEALTCFEQMQHEGLCANAVTFICVLKACGNIRALDKGETIHSDIVTQGLLHGHTVLGGALVDMYAKCGALAKAKQVLDELAHQDVVLWNTLITGYAHRGHSKEALSCFEQMHEQGFLPDAVTFACVLTACGSIAKLDAGGRIHGEIVRQGLLDRDVVLGNALIDMYAKCNVLAKAKEVLDELPVRDVASWNSLIAGYVQGGYGKESLDCFEQMHCEGLSPDTVTFACALNACGSAGAINKGRGIHAEIMKWELHLHAVLGGALVDMYGKCGALDKAREVLDELSVRNEILWNALITGYVQYGHGKEALNCLENMQCEKLSPDAITFACILRACGHLGALEKGEALHSEMIKQGLLGKNALLGITLLDMYAKCGALAKAKEVLEGFRTRDRISWNALITGYAQEEHGEEALNCFEWMQLEGISPDAVTFSCILGACAATGALDKGIDVHSKILRHGLLCGHVVIGGALVDMYAKCGLPGKAKEVLEGLLLRDVVSCNALIAGYAQGGFGKEALTSFQWMQNEGLLPNDITFLCVLTACSHSNLLVEGEKYFTTMSKVYGITPTLEHHSCMVDLFGRAGLLDKAVLFIQKLPSYNHLPMWCALLFACQKWGNVELGRWAFEHSMHLDRRTPIFYLYMTNLYAAASMQKEAANIEASRMKNKAWI